MAAARTQDETRPYDMRKRAETAGQTRAAIIEAAHGLLNRREGTLTLQEVARAAGVSRATVYNSVGPRSQLLAAVFEDQGRLIGYERVLRAAALDDARAAWLETVRESCRAWSVMPDAIRRTLALAVIDAEIGELVARYEQYRRGELGRLARRVSSAGILQAGVGVRHAAATLVLATSFPAFDLLLADASERSATDALVRVAGAVLIEDS